MSCTVWENINYKPNCDYLTSTYIREYDISKANINILLYKNIISKESYDYYMKLDRMDRQIQIGMMIKNDKKIYEQLKDGIIEFKKKFFEANNIDDRQVLSIKNDAIFLINKIPTFTKFANVEFVLKGFYTSFYLINKIEYYYYYDEFSNTEKLDIKGIGDDTINIHKSYFYEFLCVIFNSIQSDPIEEVLELINNFYIKYTNYELDMEYYRRFDVDSLFDVKSDFKYSTFQARFVSTNDPRSLDISYNANIIMELMKIISTIYFSKMR